MLAKMKYKSFVWPINPEKLEVETKRSMKSFKFPFGGFAVQDLGVKSRVIKGTGEFTGPDAYDSFRRLAELFSEGGTGWLEHPVWPPVKAYFSGLKLTEEPEEEYVRYSFEFTECADSYSLSGFTATAPETGTVKYTSAKSGDTLSAIATRFGMTVQALCALNPQLTASTVPAAGQIIRIS